ncbi:hypothetical protein BS47DRAFT_922535 [Hydnum rufescens UP504]|uniref:Uncharacterized protein n=1 Tax=Hydnum rufescens UP504 TaxID=1448309 RepID=A0A9P6E004_9AGAM|nr:hypothetical protein BS47DRAFT_922535 [Hydnum rufescens UP504]
MNPSSPLSPSPPPIPPSHSPTTIRRHHTISSSSRSIRASHRGVISEESHDWDDDEYVPTPDEWNSNNPAGAVGETPNKPLHRQASLPTGYSRDLRNVRSSAQMANRVNSLSAITAEHGGEGEGEDEDWEQEIPWNQEDAAAERPSSPPSNASNSGVPTAHRNQPLGSPLSPMFTSPHIPSPPPASGVNVRRHQSLTYGAASSVGGASKLARTSTGGRRTGGRLGALALGVVPPMPRTSSSVEDEEEEEEEEEEFEQEQEDSTPPSPIARAVWGDSRAGYGASPPLNQEWRDPVDEIQRALGTLEMQAPGTSRGVLHKNLVPPVSPTPPRFSSSPGPPLVCPRCITPMPHNLFPLVKIYAWSLRCPLALPDPSTHLRISIRADASGPRPLLFQIRCMVVAMVPVEPTRCRHGIKKSFRPVMNQASTPASQAITAKRLAHLGMVRPILVLPHS